MPKWRAICRILNGSLIRGLRILAAGSQAKFANPHEIYNVFLGTAPHRGEAFWKRIRSLSRKYVDFPSDKEINPMYSIGSSKTNDVTFHLDMISAAWHQRKMSDAIDSNKW